MKALALEQNRPMARPESLPTLIGAALLAIAVGWAYWPTLAGLANVWSHDAQYSHGWLVPLLAAGLLWHRRDMLSSVSPGLRPWGLAILLASAIQRFVGAHYYYIWIDRTSLLPCLIGLVALWGGVAGLRWAWPSIAFLFFMLPLPWSVGHFMAPTLQRIATLASTYLLQTMGFPAISEGNIILLHESRIGVVEACGGLSMLIVFFALSTAVALMVRRDWLDKLMIVASAMPIAVVCNVIRITATAIVHDQCGSAAGDTFHDVAGYLMMPLALAMLAIELKLLPRLLPAARVDAY